MSCDVLKSLLCKNIFHSLDILSSTPSFQIWSREQFCTTTPLNIFSSFHQIFGILIGVCYATLCKNPLMFFEKFERINLFFILAQLGVFYCNPNLSYSSNHELFPTYSQSYKTIKSRRVDPLEDFKCMQ